MPSKTEAKPFPVRLLIFVLFTCSILFVAASLVNAEAVPGETIKRGAQLYDNWGKVTDSKVDGNHPLYPASGKQNGASTWRCKECHGWDYIGKDGRYAKGSHFTGIAGVWQARRTNPEEIYQAIANREHALTGKLAEDDMRALAAFIAEGQFDITTAVDNDGKGVGDIVSGQTAYVANCADCHGADGNALDFKSKEDGIQGVGWLANDNPQETLHKIRWGHPGSEMPSMISDKRLTDQATIDILTYAQTLP